MHKNKVIDINKFADENSTGNVFEHRSVIQNLLDASPSRRKLLRTLGIASAMAGAVAAIDSPAQAQSSFTDIDILNFALNLEYLEAEFYTIATTGKTISQVGLTVSGSGVAGPTQGGALTPLTGAMLKIAMEIALDERTHVTLLQNTILSLGGSPIAKPAINLNALGFGFAGSTDFLTLARIFEDIGVTAYGGAAPLIKSSVVLGYAARILATEAYHASNIRLQIAQNNIATKALDGADHIPPPSGKEYFPLDANAITEVRSPGQVLFLAYGSANASSGGFFPGGANGLFNTSSATAATSDTGTTTDDDVISADPNPAPHIGSSSDAMVTISWNAPAATSIQININSPTGPGFTQGGNTGSAQTGPWVTNGMTFYLQDISGGKPLTAANTLGTVVVSVT